MKLDSKNEKILLLFEKSKVYNKLFPPGSFVHIVLDEIDLEQQVKMPVCSKFVVDLKKMKVGVLTSKKTNEFVYTDDLVERNLVDTMIENQGEFCV